MNRLIIIETSDIGARYSGLAAKKLGFDPIFVCDLRNYQADTLAQIREFDHIDMPTSEANLIVEAVKKLKDIVAVTTFLDSRLEVAVNAAQSLRVRGLDPAILKLKDKGAAYSLLPDVMPETMLINRSQILVDQQSNATFQEQIESYLQRNPKCILKPRKTAGAIGAHIFDSKPTCQAIISHMEKVNIPGFLDPDHWMIQKLMMGRLVSLEGFVANGEFTALGFTGRRKVGQTESVANFPDELPAEAAAWARKSCQTLLERAGLRFGYFHIEFITGNEGSAIIDANVGRLGGGGVGELLAISHGISPVEVFAHALQISIGMSAPSPYGIPSRKALSIAYGAKKAGRMVELRNLETIDGFHTQILNVDQHVPAMGEDNWSWIGIASGTNPDLFGQLQKIEIQLDAEVLKPCF